MVGCQYKPTASQKKGRFQADEVDGLEIVDFGLSACC